MSEATITFPLLGDGFSLSFKPYFELFGWKFYWYGVIIAVGFLLAVIYAMKRSKQFGLTEDNIIDLLIFTVVPAIICARIYYVVFQWDEYKDNFWSVFMIWKGGLAIYGGIIGAVLGAIVFSKVKKVSLTATLDVGGLGLLIGQAVGRWGNFTNREAMSDALSASSNVPWKMGLTNQYGTFYYHPCFLYESLWNALGLLILHFVSKKRKYDGQIFLMYIVWYGLGRVWIEGLRSDSLMIPGTNLRVSQLVALLCIIVGGALLIYNAIGKRHDPEDMWVNRDKKRAGIIARETALAAKKQELEADEFDEDLEDAFRMLSYKQTVKDYDPENVSEAPSVEPVDVVLNENEDADSENKEDKENG